MNNSGFRTNLLTALITAQPKNLIHEADPMITKYLLIINNIQSYT